MIEGNKNMKKNIFSLLGAIFSGLIIFSCEYADGHNYKCPDSDRFCFVHKGFRWSDVSGDSLDWEDAKYYCEELGGRLPTISELRTLIWNSPQTEYPKPEGQNDWCEIYEPDHLSGSDYLIYCEGQSFVIEDFYRYSAFGDVIPLWSSSSVSDSGGSAWGVNFMHGRIGTDLFISSNYFRCVR